MGTSNLMSNLAAGDMTNFSKGFQKVGQPVMGNTGVIPFGDPKAGAGLQAGLGAQAETNIMEPGTSTLRQAQAMPVMGGGLSMPVSQGTGNTLLPGSGGTSAPVAGAGPATPSPTASESPQQQQELNKQLVDIYGKGEGNLLNSEISNLGSDDSSYMQAYEAAMAPVNAENLSTLNTTLGNSGVGANSSTAAIANADFEANVTSGEGLQEQQLQMNDLQNLLGLTTGLEGSSQAEVSSSGWGEFLNSVGSLSSDAGSILHGGGTTPYQAGPSSGAGPAYTALAQAQGSNPAAGIPTDSGDEDLFV
jgi:hypothetical protein